MSVVRLVSNDPFGKPYVLADYDTDARQLVVVERAEEPFTLAPQPDVMRWNQPHEPWEPSGTPEPTDDPKRFLAQTAFFAPRWHRVTDDAVLAELRPVPAPIDAVLVHLDSVLGGDDARALRDVFGRR